MSTLICPWTVSGKETHRGVHHRTAAAAARPPSETPAADLLRELAALLWCVLSELGEDARTRRPIEARTTPPRRGRSAEGRRLGEHIELEDVVSWCAGRQEVEWASRWARERSRAGEVGEVGGAMPWRGPRWACGLQMGQHGVLYATLGLHGAEGESEGRGGGGGGRRRRGGSLALAGRLETLLAGSRASVEASWCSLCTSRSRRRAGRGGSREGQPARGLGENRRPAVARPRSPRRLAPSPSCTSLARSSRSDSSFSSGPACFKHANSNTLIASSSPPAVARST